MPSGPRHSFVLRARAQPQDGVRKRGLSLVDRVGLVGPASNFSSRRSSWAPIPGAWGRTRGRVAGVSAGSSVGGRRGGLAHGRLIVCVVPLPRGVATVRLVFDPIAVARREGRGRRRERDPVSKEASWLVNEVPDPVIVVVLFAVVVPVIER